MTDKQCGTCAHAQFEMTKHKPPRFKGTSSYCAYKVPDVPLPDSIAGSFFYRSYETMKNKVTPEMGTNCLCWTPKEAVDAMRSNI